jgi:hypothetical protein
MILETFDFSGFYEHVEDIFSRHFSAEQVGDLMEFVRILADANFRCYKANMTVIEARKNEDNPAWRETMDINKLVAELEWVARSVGEYRVASKARINQYISKVKSIVPVMDPHGWMSDDIVYSIGEMMDRMSIETIKIEDFIQNKRPKSMIEASEKLRNRVEKYLMQKLEEINQKRFYECVHEQRTYDLEGIVKELAI